MNPITVRDVIVHQQYAPWGQIRQVEQDLLLCRSMVAIFSDKFLKSQVAMRGGTLLHKVHVAPSARYSEDIDLVAIGNRPKGHISRALIRVLTPVLGKPTQSVWDWMKLAVRNAGSQGFCSDMTSLLRIGINYDPQEAGKLVEDRLLSLLPS